MSLSRKEAVSYQSERLTGVITLAQPLSIKPTVLNFSICCYYRIPFLVLNALAKKSCAVFKC